MEIRFFGVRGSIASSSPSTARIGGNTSCLEVRHGHSRIILDAGTGIRALGDAAMKAPEPFEATLLFSHLHWDHVQGFPFFAPAYKPDTRLHLYGPFEGGGAALRSVLEKQMEPPNFPVPFAAMRASTSFHDARPLEAFNVGEIRVTPMALPHPQGCLGFHLQAGASRFAYLTDVEVSLDTLSPDVRALLTGVDVLVLDAQYTPEEYAGVGGPPRKGWGHSTMMDAAAIAAACGVRSLYLFHHDPAHNDDAVEAMAKSARSVFLRTTPACEGLAVSV